MTKKPEKIVKAVIDYFGLKKEEFYNKSRARRGVFPRQIGAYFMFKSGMDHDEIAFFYGQRGASGDRGNVYHALKTVNNLLETDKYTREKIKELSVILNA